MAYPIQEVVQKSKGPADQSQKPRGAREQFYGGAVGLLAAGERHQPEAQGAQTQRQGDPGQSVQNRQAVADLPAIDLQMRRRRAGHGQKSMQRPRSSQSPKRVGSGPSRPPTSRRAAAGAGAAACSRAGSESGSIRA